MLVCQRSVICYVQRTPLWFLATPNNTYSSDNMQLILQNEYDDDVWTYGKAIV